MFTKKIYLGLKDYNPQVQVGYVKHAFVLTIHLLTRAIALPVEEMYDHAMYQCSLLAGDTDTNSAIVGGVIGAYVGVDNIDSVKLKKVLECNILPNQSRSSNRPLFI